ncbi:hypothetical protein HU763_018660 [Pseudomonas anuradhapurensis]|uniref:hypothetical protein n=1 Tax=Pseudomonas anuradhapurensis TaxID=485870 RepID=UPI00164471AD|nr:hypothetical protein [Pseudomonas anuradhapurensis]QXI46770.1 hypothetical protein HU763_018660 [Pseudomonas anuradhapurensis]
MNIYHFDNSPSPWGDWGAVLLQGMIAWDEHTDVDSIRRAGPYTPPAYIRSGSLVLTQPVKEGLERSGLKGISRYEHLEKTHIVQLDWLHWDTRKPITDYLELEGGPTSIIDCLPHDPALAASMPAYWQAFVVGKLNLLKDPRHEPADLGQYLQVLKADEKADFFKGDVYRGYFLSERAKAWLEQQCPGCFTFTLLHYAER